MLRVPRVRRYSGAPVGRTGAPEYRRTCGTQLYAYFRAARIADN
jgi:hypothetical protein